MFVVVVFFFWLCQVFWFGRHPRHTSKITSFLSMLDFEASMVWISETMSHDHPNEFGVYHSGGAGATHWVKFIDKAYNSLVLVVGRPGGSNCHKNCPGRNIVPKVHCFMPLKMPSLSQKKMSE